MVNPAKHVVNYFRESKEELEKVTWPTRQATIRYSIIVVGVAVLMGAFFAGLDSALNLGLEKLIGLTT
ncbi:preprotein translocase subunit SecE [bacterium]|nr:preprotein translocase subunit SecE [bacterium]